MRFRFEAARIIERVLGRRLFVRMSRFGLDYARRDVPNAMATNGEWMVQDTALRHASGAVTTVFDVGANVGAWSQRLLSRADALGVPGLRLFAFEPSAETFKELSEGMGDRYADRFFPINAALSDRGGTTTLYVVHPLAGSNSLHGVAGDRDGLLTEDVQLSTLDEFCQERAIARIQLLKVDAEGHDMLVLRGGRQLLEGHAVDLVQFEYNWRWIGARQFLKDVFDFLDPMGYRIGKITPSGVEWYPRWDPELETFREGNYLAAAPPWDTVLPAVRWWKSLSPEKISE